MKTPENKSDLLRFIGQEMVKDLITFATFITIYPTKDDQVTSFQ